MTGDYRGIRWAAMFGMLLLSITVGILAYNAGLSHGLAQVAATTQTQPALYPNAYGWHPFWGFGFPVFPILMFFFFWFFVSRLLCWGGPWRRRGWYGYGDGGDGGRYGAPPTFDEWHQRAHDRMKDMVKETPPADDPGRGR